MSSRTLDEILRKHRPALLKLARRLCGSELDPEDLVQDTCTWALAHPLVVITHPKQAYLLVLVMKHRFFDLLRRKKRRGEQGGDPDAELEKDLPLARWMDQENLEQAIRQLPPEQEQVIRLRLMDLTFREIGQRLGCSINQAFKHYQSALLLLAKYLEKP
jgi:RNA polymerase sigma-70 factor (ECF subfamily)